MSNAKDDDVAAIGARIGRRLAEAKSSTAQPAVAIRLFVEALVAQHPTVKLPELVADSEVGQWLAARAMDVSEAFGSPSEGRHIYVCGPAGFIDFITGEARRRGWSDSQVHSERFDADVDKAGDSFELVASRSGRSFVIPGDKTIAEVLLAAGVDVSVACEQGICGTCLSDVLEGIPDHRDLVQSDEEKGENARIALCCSRSLSARIVVDV